MRKSCASICVGILVVAAAVASLPAAGDENDPEVRDRARDVFGILGFLPQALFRHVDIRAAWFAENENEPESLYVSLAVRNLRGQTFLLEAIYVVSWFYDYEVYDAVVKLHPDGVYGDFHVSCNDGETHVVCKGMLDAENDVITWIVPKTAIGDPQPGDTLTSTCAVTTLRHVWPSGRPSMDLLKDLTQRLMGTPDFKYGDPYIIRY
jgi:hypothetical protein